MENRILDMARAARDAAVRLAATSLAERNAALEAVSDALKAAETRILEANRRDCERSRDESLAAPLQKRLRYDAASLSGSQAGLHSLAGLPDPLGRRLEARELDKGLDLYRMSCPIGVIGVIFESRPDALVQISSLCLKSGNAVLLKGGREALETNQALAEAIRAGAALANMPAGWIQLLETREDVRDMLALDAYIDLIVPRGSNAFVQHIMTHSRIPVMGHADGVCHLYLDADADPDMAVSLTVDAKCQYPAVCNALETLLVHRSLVSGLLPRLAESLRDRGVTLRGCPQTVAAIGCAAAEAADWRTEYLDAILAIRVVDDLDMAVAHINTCGSRHTDGIVTENPSAAEAFLQRVDSGNVFWNASTRFSDGYRYGLGAEVGISTGKLHARGPVGLDGLTTYKWILKGRGQTVAPYADGRRTFTHRPINP